MRHAEPVEIGFDPFDQREVRVAARRIEADQGFEHFDGSLHAHRFVASTCSSRIVPDRMYANHNWCDGTRLLVCSPPRMEKDGKSHTASHWCAPAGRPLVQDHVADIIAAYVAQPRRAPLQSRPHRGSRLSLWAHGRRLQASPACAIHGRNICRGLAERRSSRGLSAIGRGLGP
jgi:hypothetical protein